MGGYLNQRLGWRTAFCVVGLPGLIFSLLFYATVKELRRGATDANNPANSTYALDQVLTMLYSIKYLFGCHLLLPSTCFAFARGGLTHRFGKANKRWYLKIPGYAIMIVISCITGAYFLKLNFDGYLFGFVRPAAKHVPGACAGGGT